MWPPPDNEDSVEEISMLQGTDESFEVASDDLSMTPSPTPGEASMTEASPSGSGDKPEGAVSNGDVKQTQRSQGVKKVGFCCCCYEVAKLFILYVFYVIMLHTEIYVQCDMVLYSLSALYAITK